MELIDHSQLKRNQLYFMYNIDGRSGSKRLYFFKYIGSGRMCSYIQASIFGTVEMSHNTYNVISSYNKMVAFLPLTNSTGVSTLFHITFAEFTQHVVTEII